MSGVMADDGTWDRVWRRGGRPGGVESYRVWVWRVRKGVGAWWGWVDAVATWGI